MAERKRKNGCCWRGCRAAVHSRGACVRHYFAARRAIFRGEMTSAEAVERGLLLPSRQGERTDVGKDGTKKPKRRRTNGATNATRS